MLAYRPEIDGLRAVAVLPVILFHAGLGDFSGGYVGVDVFFVISGYLITSILIKGMEENTYSLIDFYERRARRILPALFLVIAASGVYAYFALPPTRFEDFAQSVVSVVFFASNIFFWLESGYFEQASELKPLLHTWSLAVEEQFYILFPPLLYFLFRFGRSHIGLALSALAVFSFILCVVGAYIMPSANFYLLPTRAWELLAGSLCALWLHKRALRASQAASLIGIGLIIIPMFLYDSATPFPSHYTVPVVVGTSLVVLFGGSTTWVGKLLAVKPIVSIGLISYSAYLIHQPLFAFARVDGDGHLSTSLALILTFATLALAYVSWRYIEAPFRDKKRTSRQGIFTFSVIGIGVFGAFGLTGHLTQGMPGRFDLTPSQESYLLTASASPKRSECHTDGRSYLPPSDACVYFDGTERVAVLGDSHAVELTYALAKELEPEGVSVRHLSFSSCRPSAKQNEFVTPCQAWTRDALDFLRSNRSIEQVILAYRIKLSQNDRYFPEFLAMIEELSAHKQVIVVLQAPEPGQNILDAVYNNEIVDGNLVSIMRAEWDKQLRYSREQLAGSGLNMDVVDLADALCEADVCYAGRDGTAYFFDSHHMSLAGAELAAKEILKKLPAN